MNEVVLPLIKIVGWALPVILSTAVIGTGYRFYEDRKRRKEAVLLLRAEFGYIARHSATNFKRLGTLFRGGFSADQLIVEFDKMTLRQPEIETKDALISASSISDLSTLPENLARDAMHTQTLARNIEIEIDASKLILARHCKYGGSPSADQSDTIVDLADGGDLSKSFATISRLVLRLSKDSSQLVEALKEYEEQKYTWLVVRLWLSLWRRLWHKFFPPKFRDIPLHFEDAASHREPGYWKNWSEEQRLVKTPYLQRLLLHSMPDSPSNKEIDKKYRNVTVASLDVKSICQVSKLEFKEGKYCIRIRIDPDSFQYEPHLIKEALIAKISIGKLGSDYADTKVADIARDLLLEGPELLEPSELFKSTDKGQSAGIAPRLYAYGGNVQVSPTKNLPVVITDWPVGEPLEDDSIDAAIEPLGKRIGELQETKFKHFYRNFRDLGLYSRKRSFVDAVIEEIENYEDEIQIFQYNKKKFNIALKTARSALKDDLKINPGFVMCHNKLYAKTVYFKPSEDNKPERVQFIDWDNLCVHHRLYDFVKLRYWLTKDDDGVFQINDEKVGQLLGSYFDCEQEATSTLVSHTFSALCLSWLYKVYAFERRKSKVEAPFPQPDFYRKEIKRLIKELSKKPIRTTQSRRPTPQSSPQSAAN